MKKILFILSIILILGNLFGYLGFIELKSHLNLLLNIILIVIIFILILVIRNNNPNQ